MHPPRWDTVAIIGVGAIGASIGMGLRQRGLARRVVGSTRTRESAHIALEIGAIDEIADTIEEAACAANVIVVCTPVQAIPGHVRQCATTAPKGAFITDGGSTKAKIVEELTELENAVFVGSHPIAGTHETGPRAGNPDLLVGRKVIVTPTHQTPRAATEAIGQFWTELGAQVEEMLPDVHDELLAYASHLPHLIASVMAAATPSMALDHVATGWKDSTRIAQGSVELWRQILLDNRTHTLKALEDFEKTLKAIKDALASNDSLGLTELLEQGKKNRDAVGN